MKKIDKLLKPALQSEELLQHSRAQRVMIRWEEIVGEGLARRSWPDRFTRGTVWVAVTGSAWAQELRLMKETILARLNAEANEPNLFTNIRFGVRALPTEAEIPPPPDATPTSTVEETVNLSIQEIAQRRLEKRRREKSLE